MISAEKRERDARAGNDSALTDVARTLGGGAALALAAILAAPVVAMPVAFAAPVGALVGLLGGYYIKKLDSL